MPYQIKKLLPRHLEILNLYIECKPQKEIAKEMRMTEQAVSYIVNSPVFRKEFDKRRLLLSAKVDQAYIEDMRAKIKMIESSRKKNVY